MVKHSINSSGVCFFSPFRVLIISCKLPLVSEYANAAVHIKYNLYRGFSFTMLCKMLAACLTEKL